MVKISPADYFFISSEALCNFANGLMLMILRTADVSFILFVEKIFLQQTFPDKKPS